MKSGEIKIINVLANKRHVKQVTGQRKACNNMTCRFWSLLMLFTNLYMY